VWVSTECNAKPLRPRRTMNTERTGREDGANYVSGLAGAPGTQVRFRCPSTVEEAIRIATVVEQAEIQERRGDAFYLDRDERKSRTANFENREQRGANRDRSLTQAGERRYRNSRDNVKIVCYECGGTGHMARDCATRRNMQRNSRPPDR
jgi:hypothetical protein